MDATPGDSDRRTLSLSRHFSKQEVTVDLTRCGLLVNRAEELTQLYAEHGNWNDVKAVWIDERRSGRSTKDSSQDIFRVLTSRLKNAPTTLPNASVLPRILDDCATSRDKTQVLFLYLVADDPLVRYVIHEYIGRTEAGYEPSFDFSNETLKEILNRLEYTDGSMFDYADSTTERWCKGFRSVLREIDVLEQQQAVVGTPPSIGDIPALVAMGNSYEDSDDDWIEAPRGLQYLFQPENRWEESFDRVAATNAWEYVNLHGDLHLRPTSSPYSWVTNGGTE